MANDDQPDRSPGPARQRRNMRTGIVGLKDDHGAFDRTDIAALAPGERMALAGAMFAEQWLLMGGDAKQLRLR